MATSAIEITTARLRPVGRKASSGSYLRSISCSSSAVRSRSGSFCGSTAMRDVLDWGGANTARPPMRRPGRFVKGRRSLDQPGFLVEPLGPRMQRHANAVERRVGRDRFALGMADIEQLARIVVPESLGDL